MTKNTNMLKTQPSLYQQKVSKRFVVGIVKDQSISLECTILPYITDTNISKQHQDIISKTTTVPVFVLSTRSGVIVCHTLMTRRKVCFNYVVRRTIDGDVSKKSQCINSASKCYFTVLHIYICTLVTYLFRQLLSH